jgi:hypothetical protein
VVVRSVLLLFLTVIVPAVSSFAQEKSLADAAREARAQNSHSSHSAKVFTDDDINGGAISAGDDPVEVVNKARVALARNSSHRCRRSTSGNSGPGWAEVRLVEVSGQDRIHVTIDQSRPSALHNEFILIDKDAYKKAGSAPWVKLDSAEARLLQSVQFPDALQFGYQPGDLKLIRQEAINGVPVFLYQFHSNVIKRSISIWIGVNDRLPRKTEMTTDNQEMRTSWQESTSCEYGPTAPIDAPL